MSVWLSTTLGALLAAPSPQTETFEYTIKKGDSCASIAQEVYGDHQQYVLIHRYNRWLGAQMPHHLEPGQKLTLPKKVPGEQADAKVTAARRRVEARSPDTPNWSNALPGLDLWRGWRVNTHERASAEITFRDESRIEMRESTLVIIYGGTSKKARRETAEAQLDRGALRSRLGAYTGKGDREVSVTTPSAVAEFSGGNNLVTVDDDGTSRVANHGEGKTSVRSSGKKGRKVKIKPRMGSRVNKGKAPTKPKPLPPAPAWIDRGPTVFAAAGDSGGTIRGEWGAIAAATSYRVEVSRQPDGREALANKTVPATTHDFEFQKLPAGDYYVSVAAIDDDAFESPPSPPHKLSVVSVQLRTPGAAPMPEEPEGSESATLRVLRGTRLDVPHGLRCRVDQGPPSRGPILETVGEHAVTCLDEDDALVPGFSVSVVDIRVAPASTEATVAVRGQSTTSEFSVAADVPSPRRMWVEAPEGLLVSTPTPTGEAGQFAVRVHADPGAPDQASLRIMADAGGAEVELGQISVQVDDSPDEVTPAAPAAAGPTGPERHMIEGGIFAGLAFPSPNHGLFQDTIGQGQDSMLTHAPMRAAAGSLGLRLGYYPIRWVGVELENMVGPTRIREPNHPATLFAIRGHVLGQMPWRITPTVHAGGGVLGVAALSVLGRDFDGSFHFGAGAKFFATPWFALRLDVRDVIAESNGSGVAHMPEVVLGVSGVIGRRSAHDPQRARSRAKKKK